MDENAATKEYIYMTETPVKKLVCRLAIPTIISMMITSFYNIADTYFVSNIGTAATAAVGVSFSIMVVIQALGYFFGQGTGNFISRTLGRGEWSHAEKMPATGYYSSIIVGLLLCLFGQLFLTDLAVLLGATPTILSLTKEYLRYVLAAAPVMCASLVLNNLLRYQGHSGMGMIGIAVGAVLNIGLDPLFIYVFKWGIKGAALATCIGQFASFFVLLWYSRRPNLIQIKKTNFCPNAFYLSELTAGGAPSLLRQGLAGVSSICMSQMAGLFGDSAIAAISIVARVTNTINSTMVGFAQGYQPVCGYCYGAKKYERVQEAFWFCLKLSTAVLLCVSIVMFIFAEDILNFFGNMDAWTMGIGKLALRLNSLTFTTLSWSILSNSTLQTMGKTKPATFLAATKQGLYFIPAVLILPRILDIMGLQMTQMISDALTFLTAIPLQKKVLRELNEK